MTSNMDSKDIKALEVLLKDVREIEDKYLSKTMKCPVHSARFDFYIQSRRYFSSLRVELEQLKKVYKQTEYGK